MTNRPMPDSHPQLPQVRAILHGIAERWRGLPPASGVLIATLAMLFLPGLDVIAKSLTDEMPVLQIGLGRFFFQMLLLSLIARLTSLRMRIEWRRPEMLLPGVMLALATLFIFAAYKHLPIAEALAIFFVEPLILTLFAARFLGERIGWRSITACLAGFAGTILVIQPNFVLFGWPAVFPLGTAVSFAVYMVLLRRYAARYSTFVIQSHVAVGATIVLAITVGSGWAMGVESITPVLPSLNQLFRLALLGCVATLGHAMISLALRRATASAIAPLQYLEIISATILGWWIFADFPNTLAWVGITIIVSSGLFVHARRRKRLEHS